MQEVKKFPGYFREIQTKFSRFYARILTQADLTLPQYALLNQLLDRETLPMTEVSEKLHISKPAVTYLVDRLERGNYLKRLAHPRDRRVSLLQILPKGEKIVRQVQATILHFLIKTLGQFSAREQKVITQFYGLLAKNMDQILSRAGKKRK